MRAPFTFLKPFTLEEFYLHLGVVLEKPGMWIGRPSLERLEAYLYGVVVGAGLDFDSTRIPIHNFLNYHFKKKCGSQVYWTSILQGNLPNSSDEERIAYMSEIWPEFRVWQVMTS